MPDDNRSDPNKKTKETDCLTNNKAVATSSDSKRHSEADEPESNNKTETQNDTSTIQADINQLPTELKGIIASLVSPEYSHQLLLVSKEWRNIVRKEAGLYLKKVNDEIKNLPINGDLDRISQFLNRFSRMCGRVNDRFLRLGKVILVATSLEAPIAKYIYLQQELTTLLDNIEQEHRPAINLSFFCRPQNNTLHKLVHSIMPTEAKRVNLDPNKILQYARLAPAHPVSKLLSPLLLLGNNPHRQDGDNNNSEATQGAVP
jgi:hypothetical protein